MIFKDEIDWYKEILEELKIVFDVGCRKDDVFYDLDASMEIHLFDPAYAPNHGMYSKIALSDTIGRHKYFPEYSSMHKRDLKGAKWKWLTHDFIWIDTDTLDNYCKRSGVSRIDLLKIDTEGNDLKVLLGAVKMLPNIKYIQFEDWSPESTREIKEILKDYEVTELGGKPMNYKAKRNE